jgi:hypothetical protein
VRAGRRSRLAICTTARQRAPCPGWPPRVWGAARGNSSRMDSLKRACSGEHRSEPQDSPQRPARQPRLRRLSKVGSVISHAGDDPLPPGVDAILPFRREPPTTPCGARAHSDDSGSVYGRAGSALADSIMHKVRFTSFVDVSSEEVGATPQSLPMKWTLLHP